jgi:hypothetical protein
VLKLLGIIVLIVLLIGSLPTWPHMQPLGWGYYPSGGVGVAAHRADPAAGRRDLTGSPNPHTTTENEVNKQQIIAIVQGLLVAGGPVVVILTKAFHIDGGAANDIVQALGAVVSVGGIVWLALSRTDANMAVDAATVKGVQVHVDAAVAPDAVVQAERDPEVKDVLPMVGGPRVDANKTT